MKIALTLVAGVLLGLVITHVGDGKLGQAGANADFARFHAGAGSGNPASDNSGSVPGEAMSLMQTDIALCDQPYFVEVYELTIEFFSVGIESISVVDYADALFDHARSSGYFTEQQATAWIDHISEAPGQFVEIYSEDPTLLDSCYNFQVAAVGPPA